MRILVAAPLYPPDSGGPATYVRILELGLPQRGIELELVKFPELRKYPKGIRHLIFLWKCYTGAKRSDLVLALDTGPTGFPAALAALLAKKPFVVRVPGDYAWEQGRQRYGIHESLDDFVRRGRVPFPVAVLRSAQAFVGNHADLVIAPSAYLKSIVTTWGVPAGKITVVHNAVDAPEPGIVPEAAASLGRPRIVTSARLVPWKGVHGLIDAIAALRANFPNASLTIVGDGPDRIQLETYAAARLGSNYAFTGALPHANAYAVLKNADAFVLNSSYEGLSHALIEALYAEVPIVATQAGGNAEVITDGENGFLVPVGDTGALVAALERIGGDGALRARLIAGARASTAEFAHPVMLERTAAALSGTLQP